MISKRIFSLFVLCLSLISVSATVCHPKIYVRKSPSLISKITDVGLCTTIATSTGVCIINGIFEFCRKATVGETGYGTNLAWGFGSFGVASLAATILYCKNQWQEREFIEIEHQ